MTRARTQAFVVPSPDTEQQLSVAQIVRVHADGDADVDLGSGRIARCPVLDPYQPRSGRSVQVLRRGDSWLVLGEARTSNPTTMTVTARTRIPYNVTPGTSGAANPYVVAPTASGAWRSTDGWGPGGSRPIPLDAPAQARNGTLDYYRGLWVYGAGAFAPLAGCTAGVPTLHVSRPSSGGASGATDLIVMLAADETIPDGDPYLLPVFGTVRAPGPVWGGTADIPLTAVMGQALLNREAKAVALVRMESGNGAYVVLNGISADPTCGRLTIPWS